MEPLLKRSKVSNLSHDVLHAARHANAQGDMARNMVQCPHELLIDGQVSKNLVHTTCKQDT
jgi:hypothetical protein